MQVVKFVYWEEDGAWIGYLLDRPDYWTQGESLEDLKEHLKDLYGDCADDAIQAVRKVEEMVVP
jgi:predicted RNase H-like HicB family nuclease